jgi:hypothetical protein
MIRPKEQGGCGHEHPTPEEWEDIMEATVAVEDGFDWVANGYRFDVANLIWMRDAAGRAHVALLPIRQGAGPRIN